VSRALPWDYGVRNLARSPLRTGLGALGAALVVLLILAAAAFVRGMSRSLVGSGDARNAILLGAGSEESLERSEITPAAASIAAASIRSVAVRGGVALASPEIHAALAVRRSENDARAPFANFRGVTSAAFLVHRSVRIVEGRAPGPGELLAGRLAAARMGVDDADLAVGASLWLDGRAWPIVGRMEAPGSVTDAEIWCGLDDLRVATRRETISCVVLTLTDASDFPDVETFARLRTDLELSAMRESEYYAKVMAFYGPVRAMVWVTAVLVALGAFLGGLNTTYVAFAARVREFAALQTLGFPRRAIVASLVQESLLTAAAGGIVAVAIGVFALDGHAVRISMGAFGLVVDETVVAAGLGAALAMGIVGTIPPAVRCLRRPVAEALRAI
jgi:putative ABC transport system permease protein